mgnify:CR=1 FL=1|tara:strand:+ start:919 stop:1206 length:288 start_codon:yes stop_codon:yes gene_type:complete
MKQNEISHYESLKKQDTANRKLIKKLQLDKQALKEQLSIYGVSNRLETTCAKAEPLIIEMNKEHLVELYNFAYEQAVKTGKVDELKEIDAKLNGC